MGWLINRCHIIELVNYAEKPVRRQVGGMVGVQSWFDWAMQIFRGDFWVQATRLHYKDFTLFFLYKPREK